MSAREQREVDYWRDSDHESPQADSVHNLASKMTDVQALLSLLERHGAHLRNRSAPRVIELGGGQGWGACLAKRLWPHAAVVLTDISPDAVAGAWQWERVFGTRIDAKVACRSHELAEADASADLVFCFAAAHHFADRAATLRTVARVLRPDGVAAFLYEPVCPRMWHALAYRRVNRLRPAVEEDVIVWKDLLRAGEAVGLASRVEFHPALPRRTVSATLYYGLLQRVPMLNRWMPSCANFVFTRGRRDAH